MNSPNNGDKTQQRALNLALENIFQISLRKEAQPPLKYIPTDGSDLLSSTNLSEHVFMKVMGELESSPVSAMNYFLGCYRRLLQRESSISDKISEEFARFVVDFSFII